MSEKEKNPGTKLFLLLHHQMLGILLKHLTEEQCSEIRLELLSYLQTSGFSDSEQDVMNMLIQAWDIDLK